MYVVIQRTSVRPTETVRLAQTENGQWSKHSPSCFGLSSLNILPTFDGATMNMEALRLRIWWLVRKTIVRDACDH